MFSIILFLKNICLCFTFTTHEKIHKIYSLPNNKKIPDSLYNCNIFLAHWRNELVRQTDEWNSEEELHSEERQGLRAISPLSEHGKRRWKTYKQERQKQLKFNFLKTSMTMLKSEEHLNKRSEFLKFLYYFIVLLLYLIEFIGLTLVNKMLCFKCTILYCWVGQKVHLVFSHKMAPVALSCVELTRNNFVQLHGDSCHVNMHLKKHQNW